MKNFCFKYISTFYLLINYIQIQDISTNFYNNNLQYGLNITRKNLIIGTIKNYDWHSIKLFFMSFKKSEFLNCDIVMFVQNLTVQTVNKIKKYGVIIHEIPNKFTNMRINNCRYKIYSDFLEDKLDKYNIILATDVRDVIFQKDIFRDYDTSKPFLGLAIEDANISERINKNWMISTFGGKLFETLKNKPVICSGTFLGTPYIFYKFCKNIWKEISSSNINLTFNLRHDQTIVNYIIYHNRHFKNFIRKSHNKDGHIMTIGVTPLQNIYFDFENNILNRNGKIADVIHQYDRKLEIVRILLNKFEHNKIKKYRELIYCLFISYIFLLVILYKKIKKMNTYGLN